MKFNNADFVLDFSRAYSYILVHIVIKIKIKNLMHTRMSLCSQCWLRLCVMLAIKTSLLLNSMRTLGCFLKYSSVKLHLCDVNNLMGIKSFPNSCSTLQPIGFITLYMVELVRLAHCQWERQSVHMVGTLLPKCLKRKVLLLNLLERKCGYNHTLLVLLLAAWF